MNALELKKLLDSYPEEVLKRLELAYREVGVLEDGISYKKDWIIAGHRIDDETGEFCLLEKNNLELNHKLFPLPKFYMEALEKLTNKKVILKEHTIVNPPPKYKNVTKPQELIDKCKKHDCTKSLDGVSLGKDEKGFFVYTHRARSKSYKTPEKINISDIKFVETTG